MVESHFPLANTRRDFLSRAANGFGSLALSYLLAREAKALDDAKDRRLFVVWPDHRSESPTACNPSPHRRD